ncbi:CRISPR system Cascade subunit CasC [Corynebacterium atrinae]|uniref:type I-E CRISPR-associated protein Cas7/Cse4/CasC n=1 Tax=Corynebacterium atrinae TaxID=1336740 RepID=UPI0025B3CDC9|nr:type I-E CRISPR-associated protein Cas7/Cse4/CasC [Corynebacterium atrinae]WJY64492.1 CRISPR system Cascade subunit CasC [Corynebacterium atrinae]
MSLVIDIHALQTLPPSLINRDDTGAPKSAIYGGVPRQRVSSQAWKRAIRKEFENNFDSVSIGYRTKSVVELVVKKVQELGDDSWTDDRASKAAEQAFKVAKIKLVEPKTRDEDSEEEKRRVFQETGYLLFLSPRQIENLARAIIEANGEKLGKPEVAKLIDSAHSVDIAMFGRMVADEPAYNVDASVQVAHAIGIHESEPEFDFFTAVDDVVEDRDEVGAGMMGTVQLMSSTLYRFATVDLDSLSENLGDREAAITASLAFLRAFITSLPTGKQNTFAHNTVPELVYITVRDGRSISLVNAFESPVSASANVGRRQAGAQAMAEEEKFIESEYGFSPSAAFVLGHGDLTGAFESIATKTTLPSLDDHVRNAISGSGA